MATQVVELSGDEVALLRSLEKVIQKEREHERSLGRMADAGDAAGLQLEDAMARIAKANDDAIKQTVKQLQTLGPEGKRAAEALKAGLQEKQPVGMVDDLLTKIAKFDEETAKVVESVRASLAEADQQAAFDNTLSAMRSLGGEAAIVANEIGAKLKQSADPEGAFASYLDELAKLDPEAQAIADQVRARLKAADEQAAFDNTLTAMRSLGGEAAIVANEIGAKLKQSADPEGAFANYLDELARLDPEAKAIADQVRARLKAADDQSNFELSIKSLRELGPAGKAIADRLAEQMKTAAAEAAGGMDSILDRLKAINPEVEQIAAQIKAELAAADAQTNFDNTITELQKINPEAAAAARKVREQMDLADADVKFDNMIAELQKLDPEAAKAAASLRDRMKSATDDSGGFFANFSKSAVTQIGAVAGSYLGIQEAITLVNDYLKEQEQLLQNALDKQLELAKAQQEAAKNLASYKAVERDELLQVAVGEIAREADVADAAQITLALGEAASAGATPEEARAAVLSAARANKFSTEAIGAATGGAVSVMKQTGLSDPRQAMALLQTAGPLSKIKDSSKVAESLPRALGTVATVREQSPEEAAKQVASLFAVATNVGVDESGQSTATFTIDFVNRMNSLFTDLQNKQIDARSKIELIDRKIEKGTDTEANRRDKAQLEQFLKESAGVVDPKTIFGRLQVLQSSQGMQQQFLGETGKFGEQQFQVFLKDVLDANSETARSVIAGANQIQANSAYFEQSVASIENSTPQQALRRFAASGQAESAVSAMTNQDGAALAELRKRVATDLAESRPDGVVLGLVQSVFGETGIERGWMEGTSFAEEAVSGISSLRGGIAMLADGGITAEEAPKVDRLRVAISDIEKLLIDYTQRGTISRQSAIDARSMAIRDADAFARAGDANSAQMFSGLAEKISAALERQNELMEEQNALMAETADNTRPGDAPPPDMNALQTAALAEADAR